MLKNRKNIFIFILFLVLILILAIIWISFNTQTYPTKRELIKTLTPLECDLNENGICEVSKNGKTVIFKISKYPIEAMEEFNVSVQNLDNCDNLNMRIYGLNMYMGSLIPKFNKTKNGCETTAVLSACSLKTMRFRLELFKGNKSLGFYSDMDLKR